MFCTIVKTGIFGLGMASKEYFLANSTEFIFLIIRLVPGNVVMVTIDMYEKSQKRGRGYMKLRERKYYLLCFLFFYLFSLFNNIFTFLYL